MSTFDTHIYAVVRIKIADTGFAGGTPEAMAEHISDAVCAASGDWLRPMAGCIPNCGWKDPVTGAVVPGSTRTLKVEHVEFADEVSWVMVDEKDVAGDIVAEHHFDWTLAPMTGLQGFSTAVEVRQAKQIADLESTVRNLNAQIAGLNLMVGADAHHLSLESSAPAQ